MQQCERAAKVGEGLASSQIQENHVTDRGRGSRQVESMPDTQDTRYPSRLQLGEAGPTNPVGTTGSALTMRKGANCKNGGGRAAPARRNGRASTYCNGPVVG